MKNFVIRLLCLSLVISVVGFAVFAQKSRGTKIPAGNDLWQTATHGTGELMSVPENFFGEGSLPFTGFINYKGDPRSGVRYDTNIRREQEVTVPGTTSLKVVELYLKSNNKIEVGFRDGTTSVCEIFVELSPSVASKGTMTITKESWSSSFTVVPSYTIKCDRTNAFGGVSTVTRDMGTPMMQSYLREKSRASQQNLFNGIGTRADEMFAGLAPRDDSGIYGAQFRSADNTWKIENGSFQSTTEQETKTTIESFTECGGYDCAWIEENGIEFCHCVQSCPSCNLPLVE